MLKSYLLGKKEHHRTWRSNNYRTISLREELSLI